MQHFLKVVPQRGEKNIFALTPKNYSYIITSAISEIDYFASYAKNYKETIFTSNSFPHMLSSKLHS